MPTTIGAVAIASTSSVGSRVGAEPGTAAGPDGPSRYRAAKVPAWPVRATESGTGAARLMDAARVKRMPVLDGGGRLIGIVSRRDLVRMYTRPDPQVRASVAEGVLRSLWVDPAQLDITVRAGIV